MKSNERDLIFGLLQKLRIIYLDLIFLFEKWILILRIEGE